MQLKKLSELETDISFSTLSYDLCAPSTQGRGLGCVSVELHLPSEAIRLALVSLPTELLPGTWQTKCLGWHPGQDMMMITCSTVCESALSLVLWLWPRGVGWLEKFVCLEDPQSLLPSSGIAAVWVVTVSLLVILVLLEEHPSWTRGRDGSSRKRWGPRWLLAPYTPILLPSYRPKDFFKYLFILAILSLSCSPQDLHCSVQTLSCGMLDLVP